MSAEFILLSVTRYCTVWVIIHKKTAYSKQIRIGCLHSPAKWELVQFALDSLRKYFSGLDKSIYILKRITKVITTFACLWDMIFCVSHRSINNAYMLSNTWDMYDLINFTVFPFLSLLVYVFNILFYIVSSPDWLTQDCCSNLIINRIVTDADHGIAAVSIWKSTEKEKPYLFTDSIVIISDE